MFFMYSPETPKILVLLSQIVAFVQNCNPFKKQIKPYVSEVSTSFDQVSQAMHTHGNYWFNLAKPCVFAKNIGVAKKNNCFLHKTPNNLQKNKKQNNQNQ